MSMQEQVRREFTESSKPTGLCYAYLNRPPERCGLREFLGCDIWECGALSTIPQSEWTAHLRKSRNFRLFGGQ